MRVNANGGRCVWSNDAAFGNLSSCDMTEPTPRSGGGVAPPDPAPVLLAGASPRDKVELALDAEFDLIERAVRLGSHRDRLRIVLSHDTETSELVQKMLDDDPSVVHFSGHGNERAELYFEDADGQSVAVDAETLRQMFAAFTGVVRCVVLNACYSATQAEVIAHHVDCVIGMSDRVSDAAAHSFASTFYRHLASGRDAATAFDLAVVNIDLEGIPEAKTPALFGRERAALLVFDGRHVVDKEVTTTIAAGVEPLVRELYESEYLPLVRLASTIVDSVSVCEGIVQEAFTKMLTTPIPAHAATLDGVLGALRRLVLDIARHRRAEALAATPVQGLPTIDDATGEATKALRALQALPAAEADALMLGRLARLDATAVAASLRSDPELETKVASALRTLTSLLEPAP